MADRYPGEPDGIAFWPVFRPSLPPRPTIPQEDKGARYGTKGAAMILARSRPRHRWDVPVKESIRTDVTRISIDQTVGEALAQVQREGAKGRIVYFYVAGLLVPVFLWSIQRDPKVASGPVALAVGHRHAAVLLRRGNVGDGVEVAVGGWR